MWPYRYPDDFLRKTYHTTHCICSFTGMHHSINKKEDSYHPNVSVLYFFSNCVTFIFYNFIFSFKTMDTHVTSEKKSKSYQITEQIQRQLYLTDSESA